MVNHGTNGESRASELVRTKNGVRYPTVATHRMIRLSSRLWFVFAMI
ncbi:MAG: hypothetical protein ACJA07_004303 [Rhodococcus sp. (in: high G+C Gram-positive bacteria)]